MDRNKKSKKSTKSKLASPETGGGLLKTKKLKRGRSFKPRQFGAQFSLAEKKKVLQAVKKYDIDEVGRIQAEFLPHRTCAEVGAFLRRMTLKAASHVEPTEKMPIELWARMAEDLCSGTHDWSPVLAEVFDKIASEEVHGSKLDPEDPDWPLLYEYIACQLRGDEPPPLGQLESLILLDLIDALLARVKLLDISQQRPLMERKYRLLSRRVRRTNHACAFKLGRRALQEDLRDKNNDPCDRSAEAGNATVPEGCITESDPSHPNPTASATTSQSDALHGANDEDIFNEIRNASMYTLNPFGIPVKYIHLKLRDNTANSPAAAQARETSSHINHDMTQATCTPPSVAGTAVRHDWSSTANKATGIHRIDADLQTTAKKTRKRHSISASASVGVQPQSHAAVNVEVQAVVSSSSFVADIAAVDDVGLAEAEDVSVGSKARKRRKKCTDAGVVGQEAAGWRDTQNELILVCQSAFSAEIAVKALDYRYATKEEEVSLGSSARKQKQKCTDTDIVTVNSSFDAVGQEATEFCSTQNELPVIEAPRTGTVDREKYPKQRSISNASFELLDSEICSSPQISAAVLVHSPVTHSSAHLDESKRGIASQSLSSGGISVKTTNAKKRRTSKKQSAKSNASSSAQNQEAETSKTGNVRGVLVKEKQVADLPASGSKSHVTGLAVAQLVTEAAKFVSGRTTRMSKSANPGTIVALQSANEYNEQKVSSSLCSVTEKVLENFPLTSNNAAANSYAARKWRSKSKEGRSLSPTFEKDPDVLLRCRDFVYQPMTETQKVPSSCGQHCLSADATSRSTATAAQQQRKSERQSAKSQFVKHFKDQDLARFGTLVATHLPELLHPTVESGKAKMLTTVDAVSPLNSSEAFFCSEPLSATSACKSASADAIETKKPAQKRELVNVSQSETSDVGMAKQRRAKVVSGVTAIDTLARYRASLPVMADNATFSERRLVIQIERLNVDTDNKNSYSDQQDSKNSHSVSVPQVTSARVRKLKEKVKRRTTVCPSSSVEVNYHKSSERPAKRSSGSSERKHTRSPIVEQKFSEGDSSFRGLAAALIADQQFPYKQSSPVEQKTEIDMLAQRACSPSASLDMSHSGTVVVVQSPTMFQNSDSTGRHQVKRLQIQRQSVIDIPPRADFCNAWNA